MTFTPAQTIGAIASVNADPEVEYILAIEARLEAAEKAAEVLFIESDISQIEVDSYYDSDFGLLYRVWKGCQRLGNFYRSPVNHKWVAQPFCCRDRNLYDTAKQAQAAVIAAWR